MTFVSQKQARLEDLVRATLGPAATYEEIHSLVVGEALGRARAQHPEMSPQELRDLAVRRAGFLHARLVAERLAA